MNKQVIASPWSCWSRICPAFANRVDPDQLASSEANWSGSAPFVNMYVNLYQQPDANAQADQGLHCPQIA